MKKEIDAKFRKINEYFHTLVKKLSPFMTLVKVPILDGNLNSLTTFPQNYNRYFI